MRFKIGDRVCDREDGDVGVIKEEHPNGWWVLWETGDATGERLWLEEIEMDLVENDECSILISMACLQISTVLFKNTAQV